MPLRGICKSARQGVHINCNCHAESSRATAVVRPLSPALPCTDDMMSYRRCSGLTASARWGPRILLHQDTRHDMSYMVTKVQMSTNGKLFESSLDQDHGVYKPHPANLI